MKMNNQELNVCVFICVRFPQKILNVLEPKYCHSSCGIKLNTTNYEFQGFQIFCHLGFRSRLTIRGWIEVQAHFEHGYITSRIRTPININWIAVLASVAFSANEIPFKFSVSKNQIEFNFKFLLLPHQKY